MEFWKLNWSKFPKQGTRVNPLYRTEANRLPGSDSDTRLCYIYPNRPLPFNFLCAFPTFIRCFSLEEPSAESFPRFRIDRASQSSRHGRVRFTSSRLKPCDPPLSGCCLLTQPPRPPLFYFSLLSLSLNLS